MTIWLVILGMAAVTFALRASFLVLPERVRLSESMRRALRYVPPAVLTAIWAPELLLHQGNLDLSADNERLFAGAAAIAIAWRTRQTFLTIVAGLVTLHVIAWAS